MALTATSGFHPSLLFLSPNSCMAVVYNFRQRRWWLGKTKLRNIGKYYLFIRIIYALSPYISTFKNINSLWKDLVACWYHVKTHYQRISASKALIFWASALYLKPKAYLSIYPTPFYVVVVWSITCTFLEIWRILVIFVLSSYTYFKWRKRVRYIYSRYSYHLCCSFFFSWWSECASGIISFQPEKTSSLFKEQICLWQILLFLVPVRMSYFTVIP